MELTMTTFLSLDVPATLGGRCKFHASVWRPNWHFTVAEFQAEYERRLSELHERLHNDARASFRAMDGWDKVRNEAGWTEAVMA
jgi:hypothetical protein